MWETFLSITLLGSFVWWCIITAVLLIIFFISEVKENGYVAFGFAVAYLTLFYFKGNQDLGVFLDWIYLLMYLGIGIIYSVIRTLNLGLKSKNEVQKHINSTNWDIKSKKDAIKYKKRQREQLLEKLDGNVFRWWFMWTISLIVWTLSNLMSDFWNWLWKTFRSFFEEIFNLGFGKDDNIIFEEKENDTK